MFKKLAKLLSLWPEWISVPLGLIAWMISPAILRKMDPTAGIYDSGVLQTFLYALIGMLIFNGLSWLGMYFNLRSIFSYYASGELFTDFKNLNKCLKIVIALSVFFAYLFGLIALSVIIR